MHRLRFIASALFCSFTVLLPQDKPTIAVLEFDGFGLSGPEIQTLTNRLRTNMTQLGVYRVIERGLMQQILMEQDFQLTGCTSDECAVEIGQLLGAQFMLAGSIGKVGNTWTIEMRIVNVESGAVIRSASYDTQGAIDVVLTEGMGAAARKISSVELAESTPAAARPILRPGIVDILAAPAGAIIFIDNVDMGNTAVTGVELEPGVAHGITIRRDRYHPADTTVTLEAGERGRLDIELRPMMGYLTLKGDSQARVKANGKAVGRTPLAKHPLQMGPYDLKITKPEYFPHVAQMVVEYNHITTVDYVLKPKPKGRAVLISLALPGGGQAYMGYKKGWVVLAASAVAGAMAYSGNSKYEQDFDTYQTLLDDYNRETDIELALQKKAAVQKSFDVMKSSEQERNLYIGALGGLWLYNIIDITF